MHIVAVNLLDFLVVCRANKETEKYKINATFLWRLVFANMYKIFAPSASTELAKVYTSKATLNY